MGYGPLVQATVGVTSLWTSDDAADPTRPHAFYDATTIFPDHVVGRISAIGALAALIRRQRTGSGARIPRLAGRGRHQSARHPLHGPGAAAHSAVSNRTG